MAKREVRKEKENEDRRAGKKTLWSTMLGTLDKPLREAAAKLAAGVPKDSPLRSGAIETALGALKGFVGAYAERFPPFLSAGIERITDFFDAFSTSLGTQEGKKAYEEVSDKWMQDFFKHAGIRLSKVRDASSLKNLEDQLTQEFEIRCRLMELIKSKSIKPEDKKIDHSNWRKEFRKIKSKTKKIWKSLDSKADWASEKLLPLAENLAGKKFAKTGGRINLNPLKWFRD